MIEMDFFIFIVIGFILWRVTSFGIDKLESTFVWFSFVKKGIFWLILAPLWLLYGIVAVSALIQSTDAIDENFLDKKNIYLAYCSDFKHNIYSCPEDKEINTMKINFKVSFDRQFVVQNAFSTYKYNQCSVFDINNWECEADENKIQVRDGKYSEYNQKNNYPTIDKDGKPSILPINNSIEKSEYIFREIIQFFGFFN